jgi:hypothetical protein
MFPDTPIDLVIQMVLPKSTEFRYFMSGEGCVVFARFLFETSVHPRIHHYTLQFSKSVLWMGFLMEHISGIASQNFGLT